MSWSEVTPALHAAAAEGKLVLIVFRSLAVNVNQGSGCMHALS